jgi:hypothetical protein
MMSRVISLLLASLALFSVPAIAQESVTINYEYTGNASLSSIRPSIQFAAFTDSRGLGNPNLLVAEGLGSTNGIAAEAPLVDIVRDAFVQAFTKGGATVVDTDGEMTIAGEISESSVEIVDRNGVESIQLTIRTAISLQSGGRSIYSNNMFGRGVVPATEGIESAVHAALDRMIRDLSSDDYFMIELM